MNRTASGFICLLFTTLLIATALTGYGSERDSLLQLLRNHPQNDSVRVRLLCGAGFTYLQSNLDSTEVYASEGLDIASKIKYDAGISACAKQLGIVHLHRHESEKALQYFRQSLDIFTKKGDRTMQEDILIYMGDIYYRDTRYSAAIEVYSKAAKICEEIGDIKQQGLALIDIGGVYTDQGNYAGAINYYLQGLKAFEKAKDDKGIAMTLVNIGNIYANMGNFPKALEYINKSLPITLKTSDKEVIFSNMVNIGVAYGQMKDYRNALSAFNNGLVIADSLGDKTWQNNCLGNIADIYFQMGAYDTAYARYMRLLNQPDGLTDTVVQLSAKSAIGSILIKKGKTREGIDVLLPALAVAQAKQIRQTIFDISRDLSIAYEQLHDYREALKYHKIYFNYRDSLNNEKIDKRIQQLQFDHELDKKEREIEILKKDNLITEGKTAKQTISLVALLSVVVLLSSITILLYRKRGAEKRNKEEALKQKENIAQQALQLEDLNRFKDKTFSVISHDLRSPLGTLTSALMLLDRNLLTPDEFSHARQELNKQLNSVNILLDNLLNWSKGYFQGKVPAKPEVVEINDVAARNIHLLHDLAGGKQITLVNNIKERVQVFCDPGQLDIVVRNLLSNAVKFTNNNGSVTISANYDNKEVRVIVSDTGVGMSKEQLGSLFTSTGTTSTYGTGGEKGIGLGLMLCYEFVIANNGNISVTSEEGKGSMFTIMLPAAPNP